MGKLIILIVIVLGVLAIAQLVRLYELSSKLRDRREEDITHRDNRLNATMLLVFMLLLFVGFIWLMLTYGWTGRGDSASEHGVAVDSLLNLNFWIIIAVFFLTNSLLFGFAFKYARKPGVKAYYFPHDNRLELVWTVVPAIVLAVIIILGLRSWNEQTDESPDDAIRVELFSRQFGWTVRMSGEDNKLGYFDYKLTNENNPLALMTTESIQNAIDSMEFGQSGIIALEKKLNNRKIMLIPEERDLMKKDLDRKERLLRLLYQMKARHSKGLDARAYDDLTFTEGDTLYLCQNTNYEFNFRAKDVIHSAYFPHFRAQMNTVPGMTTRLKFKPTVTTAEMREKMHDPMFNYILMCNKICGGAHYKMKLMVVVLPKKEYDQWYLGVNWTGTKKQKEALKKLLGRELKADDISAMEGKSKVFRNIYSLTKKVEAPAPVAGTDSIPAVGDTLPAAATALAPM